MQCSVVTEMQVVYKKFPCRDHTLLCMIVTLLRRNAEALKVDPNVCHVEMNEMFLHRLWLTATSLDAGIILLRVVSTP